MILETERLLLRPHRIEDAPFLVRLNSDPEVVRYTGNTAFESLADAEEVIRRVMAEHERGLGRLMVVERATGECLGFCGLKEIGAEVDLGYRLLRRVWGRGYATESSREVVRHGFEDLGLERIVARAMPANVASIRVLEKLSFTRVGQAIEEDGATWVKFARSR